MTRKNPKDLRRESRMAKTIKQDWKDGLVWFHLRSIFFCYLRQNSASKFDLLILRDTLWSILLNSYVQHQFQKKALCGKRRVVLSTKTTLQYVTFLMNFPQKTFYLRSYHARLSLWTITQHFDLETSARQMEHWWKCYEQIQSTFLPGSPLSPGKPKPPCSP